MSLSKAHPVYKDYLIEESGEVFSTLSNKYLKQKTRKDGYKEVSLRLNGKSISCLVHRLVLEVFKENVNNYEVCNHINGNRADNNILNLEWITQKENCSEAKSKQKQISQENRGANIAKFSLDGELINTYPSIREAARQNGCADSTLHNALRKGNQSVGFIWKRI